MEIPPRLMDKMEIVHSCSSMTLEVKDERENFKVNTKLTTDPSYHGGAKHVLRCPPRDVGRLPVGKSKLHVAALVGTPCVRPFDAVHKLVATIPC